MSDIADFQLLVYGFCFFGCFLTGHYVGKIAGIQKEQDRQSRVIQTNYDLANQKGKGGSSPR
jgi:hypothetical protein